jgi:hypothetical protein
MIPTFLIITCIWALAHFYVGARLMHPIRLSRAGRYAAWAVLALNVVLLPLSFALGRVPDRPIWLTAAQVAAYVGMGVFGLVFPLLLLRDLGWFSMRGVDWLVGVLQRSGREPDEQRRAPGNILPADPERRLFLLRSANIAILGVSGSLAGFGYNEARQAPDVVVVPVHIPELPPELEGYRIAQISDTHVGPSIRRERMEEIVAATNALRPDMIALTGDLVDGFVPEMRPHVAPIGDLKAPDGVYFVTGNHEYYWDLQGWLAEVKRLGLTVLLNEHRIVSRGGRTLLVAGVADYSADRHGGGHASNPAAASAGAPKTDVRILLAHQPRSIYAATHVGYDLQLSGHTHGGQFYPWIFFVPLQQPYVAGLYRHENTWVYVNRGAGYWGPPMRIGAPSEITLLQLTAHAVP